VNLFLLFIGYETLALLVHETKEEFALILCNGLSKNAAHFFLPACVVIIALKEPIKSQIINDLLLSDNSQSQLVFRLKVTRRPFEMRVTSKSLEDSVSLEVCQLKCNLSDNLSL
jgi:hypothetical protein